MINLNDDENDDENFINFTNYNTNETLILLLDRGWKEQKSKLNT